LNQRWTRIPKGMCQTSSNCSRELKRAFAPIRWYCCWARASVARRRWQGNSLARQFAGGRKAETRQRQGRVFRLEVETRFHCASGQQILSAQQMGRSRGHSRFESACAESCLIQSCRCDCRNDHEKHETRINCQFHGIHPVSEAAYLLKLFLFISCFSCLSWFEPPLSGSFPLRPRRARNDKSPATSRPPGSASFPDLD